MLAYNWVSLKTIFCLPHKIDTHFEVHIRGDNWTVYYSSILLHLFWAQPIKAMGRKQRSPRENMWPAASRTWLSWDWTQAVKGDERLSVKKPVSLMSLPQWPPLHCRSFDTNISTETGAALTQWTNAALGQFHMQMTCKELLTESKHGYKNKLKHHAKTIQKNRYG